MADNKAESLRNMITSKSSEQLRDSISNSGDISQYSPAVMQNKALLMYAEADLDSFYEVTQEQIPYIAYIRAINEKIPIPGTMRFLNSQLSLSRSKDRQGRKEFGQALNKQPVVVGGQSPINLSALQQEPQKESILSKLFKKRNNNEGVQ